MAHTCLIPSILTPLTGIKHQLPKCKLFWLQKYLSLSYHINAQSLQLTVDGLVAAGREYAE